MYKIRQCCIETAMKDCKQLKMFFFYNSNSKVPSELLMCLWFNTSDNIIYSQIEFPFVEVTAGNLYAAPERAFSSLIYALTYSKWYKTLYEVRLFLLLREVWDQCWRYPSRPRSVVGMRFRFFYFPKWKMHNECTAPPFFICKRHIWRSVRLISAYDLRDLCSNVGINWH